ncbi:MAG: hypothetical protein A2885_13530 [Sphingopyxis sp. RIFCSPHIGHO2_01_FULL_65_24]|nr:MAG: hypothetical protein A2885_13530 [Sphingopyxis sp. RIFCSPHIGHO2_01_FULL_65_24]
MHRMDRQDLRDSFFIKIKTMRQGRHRSGRHPMPDLKDDNLAGQLAAALVDIVDGDSRMVIRTEEKPQSHGVHGKWGIDEPWPDGIEPK